MRDSKYKRSKKDLLLFYSLILSILITYILECDNQDPIENIVISKPVSGDTYIAGDTLLVNWQKPIDQPGLSYRYTPLEKWDTLKAITITGTSVKTLLPDTWFSDNFQIRVEDRSGAINAGISGYFKVLYISLKKLKSDTIFTGDTVILQWGSNPSKFNSIRIKLSTDNGKSFNDLLSKSLSAQTKEYAWIVGGESSGFSFRYPSDNCFVLIQDYSNSSYADLSTKLAIRNRGEK